MKINPDLPLILKDVRVYDIEACHATILLNKGFDLSHLDLADKLQRNIAIGKMMRENPRITSLLRITTESIINDYLNVNHIQDNNVVIRQYDGLILTKKLDVTNLGHIPLEMRESFRIFISSIKRNSYIAIASYDNNIKVKGVAHQYEKMNEIYCKLCKVSIDSLSIFEKLQKIKDEFFNSEDPNLFGIPLNENKFNVFLKGYGELEVSKSTLNIMDTDDIDKDKYFKFYIEPFTKSIVSVMVNY